MMGPTHSASALAAGLGFTLLSNAQGWYDFSAAQAFVFAGITAGAGLLPDLDHPSATLARTWGPVSRLMAKATNATSAAVANLTAGPRDRHVENGHRKLTHVALFCWGIAPALVFFGITLGGYWAQMAIVYFFVTLASQGLFKKRMRSLGPFLANGIAIVITFALARFAPETISPAMLAFATALGCTVHVLGDKPTVRGTPHFFAPLISSRGKRWDDTHGLLPSSMTVSASGWANTALLWISIALSAYFGYMVISLAA